MALGPQYPFPLLIKALQRIPLREEIYDDVVFHGGRGLDELLTMGSAGGLDEDPDAYPQPMEHADLLADDFLTPLMMEAYANGPARARRALAQFGYDWTTELADPDETSHGPRLSVAEWVACCLPPARQKELWASSRHESWSDAPTKALDPWQFSVANGRTLAWMGLVFGSNELFPYWLDQWNERVHWAPSSLTASDEDEEEAYAPATQHHRLLHWEKELSSACITQTRILSHLNHQAVDAWDERQEGQKRLRGMLTIKFHAMAWEDFWDELLASDFVGSSGRIDEPMWAILFQAAKQMFSPTAAQEQNYPLEYRAAQRGESALVSHLLSQGYPTDRPEAPTQKPLGALLLQNAVADDPGHMAWMTWQIKAKPAEWERLWQSPVEAFVPVDYQRGWTLWKGLFAHGLDVNRPDAFLGWKLLDQLVGGTKMWGGRGAPAGLSALWQDWYTRTQKAAPHLLERLPHACQSPQTATFMEWVSERASRPKAWADERRLLETMDRQTPVASAAPRRRRM